MAIFKGSPLLAKKISHMAILVYNEIRERRYIIMDNEPYEVLTAHVFRKQQRKPVNATKLRNLITGSVVEHSFAVSDKVEEAELESRKIKYLFSNKGEFWFCEEKDPSKRFSMKEEIVGSKGKFLKQNTILDILTFQDRLVCLKLPVKVDLRVIEAVNAVKGNTVSGGSKAVKLETGAEIYVPMFINEGDVLRINTETEEYTERVTK